MDIKYDPKKHDRHSPRLKEFDYSQEGAYFVTICTRHMIHRFGYIENEEMILNNGGIMINENWLALHGRFANIEFGQFITMPNHFHAVLFITASPDSDPDVEAPHAHAQHMTTPDPDPNVEAPLVGAQLDNHEKKPAHGQPRQGTVTLSEIIGAFKSITTLAYIDGVNKYGWPRFDRKLWQRSFHDHIIRDETTYQKITEYILTNPARWQDDTYFS